MKRTISEKLLNKLKLEISLVMNLGDVKEFEETEHRILFDDPPEKWTEIEIAISAFLMRKEAEIIETIKNFLLKTN